MNTDKRAGGMDMQGRLSTLWIFVLLNMTYADILSLMDSESPLRQVMAGAWMSPMPSGFVLAAAVLMESSIAMIVLSRVLPYRANRWVNTIVGAVNILAVIAGGRGLYYVFFATMEVAGMLLIIWFAWKWKPAVESTVGAPA